MGPAVTRQGRSNRDLKGEANSIANDIADTRAMPDLNRAKVRIDRFAAQSNLANERKVEVEKLRTLYASQERKFLAANGILSIQQKFNEACELRDVVKAAEILVAARVDLDSVNGGLHETLGASQRTRRQLGQGQGTGPRRQKILERRRRNWTV